MHAGSQHERWRCAKRGAETKEDGVGCEQIKVKLRRKNAGKMAKKKTKKKWSKYSSHFRVKFVNLLLSEMADQIERI